MIKRENLVEITLLRKGITFEYDDCAVHMVDEKDIRVMWYGDADIGDKLDTMKFADRNQIIAYLLAKYQNRLNRLKSTVRELEK